MAVTNWPYVRWRFCWEEVHTFWEGNWVLYLLRGGSHFWEDDWVTRLLRGGPRLSRWLGKTSIERQVHCFEKGFHILKKNRFTLFRRGFTFSKNGVRTRIQYQHIHMILHVTCLITLFTCDVICISNFVCSMYSIINACYTHGRVAPTGLSRNRGATRWACNQPVYVDRWRTYVHVRVRECSSCLAYGFIFWTIHTRFTLRSNDQVSKSHTVCIIFNNKTFSANEKKIVVPLNGQHY